MADLSAERILSAERDNNKIAVEIKVFGGKSKISESGKAIGQYGLFEMYLKEFEPDRVLFLMDKLNQHRKIISKILQNLANYDSSPGQTDEFAICDEKNDNHILFNVGWHPNGRRRQISPIYIRISQVFVEWNDTNQEIVQQLIDAGISENDIVLGWKRPQEIVKAA